MSKITSNWNNTDEEMLKMLRQFYEQEQNKKKAELTEELYHRYAEKIDKEELSPSYEELKTELNHIQEKCDTLSSSHKSQVGIIEEQNKEIKNLRKEVQKLQKFKAQANMLDLKNLHKLNEDLKNENRS